MDPNTLIQAAVTVITTIAGYAAIHRRLMRVESAVQSRALEEVEAHTLVLELTETVEKNSKTIEYNTARLDKLVAEMK